MLPRRRGGHIRSGQLRLAGRKGQPRHPGGRDFDGHRAGGVAVCLERQHLGRSAACCGVDARAGREGDRVLDRLDLPRQRRRHLAAVSQPVEHGQVGGRQRDRVGQRGWQPGPRRLVRRVRRQRRRRLPRVVEARRCRRRGPVVHAARQERVHDLHALGRHLGRRDQGPGSGVEVPSVGLRGLGGRRGERGHPERRVCGPSL